ncbi:hypothetical protein COC69_15100 [Bacillus cereus]|uniref:Uncharacterized protein n=1 Tax=Bacillus cereus TaxID=1396 RepID=A0A9X7GVN4_BACCE|nr:hypothetical protein [Bacillus cereus]PGS78522.1 hypothetical protein COC69_15100 [Bacillus cereus]
MLENNIAKEESFRIKLPTLYKKMLEVFQKYHIHPFDIQGTIIKKDKGYDVIIRFSPLFSNTAKTFITFEKMMYPDEGATRF